MSDFISIGNPITSKSGSTACGYLSIQDTDTTGAYSYYGGYNSDGVYKINRYDSNGIRTQATGAWADRTSLTYI